MTFATFGFESNLAPLWAANYFEFVLIAISVGVKVKHWLHFLHNYIGTVVRSCLQFAACLVALGPVSLVNNCQLALLIIALGHS